MKPGITSDMSPITSKEYANKSIVTQRVLKYAVARQEGSQGMAVALAKKPNAATRASGLALRGLQPSTYSSLVFFDLTR